MRERANLGRTDLVLAWRQAGGSHEIALCFSDGVGAGWGRKTEEKGMGAVHLDNYTCKYRVSGQMSNGWSMRNLGERRQRSDNRVQQLVSGKEGGL